MSTIREMFDGKPRLRLLRLLEKETLKDYKRYSPPYDEKDLEEYGLSPMEMVDNAKEIAEHLVEINSLMYELYEEMDQRKKSQKSPI